MRRADAPSSRARARLRLACCAAPPGPSSYKLSAVSIYGPPPREPPRALGRPEVRRGLWLLLAIFVVSVGLGVGLVALESFQADQRAPLEIDHTERSLEATRLQTAELLPPIPEPPALELPAPLQTAELLPDSAVAPAAAPPEPVQAAERLPDSTPAPRREPLQVAEILP